MNADPHVSSCIAGETPAPAEAQRAAIDADSFDGFARRDRAAGRHLGIPDAAGIVYWNSTYIADAAAHLRANGEIVPDEFLANTSLVRWDHIAFSGDFLWDRAAAMAPVRRPLNRRRTNIAA